MLKESVGITAIIKRILDRGENWTIVKLLVLALAIENQLTKAISKNKIMQI